MKRLTLILGGEKSGKSDFALKEGERIGGKKAFLATAVAFDGEMKEKIERHKRIRGEGWVTFEEPLRISEKICEIEKHYDVIVLDCLTVWLGNLMHHGLDLDSEISKFLNVISRKVTELLLVSNEVGLGIIPENEIARRFIVALGNLNKEVAKISDRVIFMVCGLPIFIKDLSKGGWT